MTELDAQENPFQIFQLWFEEARESEKINPNAMSVSTLSPDGQPSSRMVLLKEHSPKGFVFYTNMTSRKAQDLSQNSKLALLFYWTSLARQVRIEGTASPVSSQKADRYFATRPLGAQWGAWASRQSQPLESREKLEQEVAAVAARSREGSLARPAFWSGFCVRPHRFEFWQEQSNRLHDRFLFTKQKKGSFLGERLYP